MATKCIVHMHNTVELKAYWLTCFKLKISAKCCITITLNIEITKQAYEYCISKALITTNKTLRTTLYT